MSDDDQITLGSLTDNNLLRWPVWKATGQYVEGDEILVPAQLTDCGEIPPGAGEVWCSCVCRFANGKEVRACAVCWADRADGPRAWAVNCGNQVIRLIVPPAPSFVLDR